MDLTTFYVLAIIFVATLIRSTFGLGESLIAVPLLTLLVPIETAVPLSVLTSVLIAAVVVVQDRGQIHSNSAKWLIIFAVMGLPIGLSLLVHGDGGLIRSALWILIVLYSACSLLSKNSFKLGTDNRAWLFICGFLSGVLGGAYGLNGPPLVVYGNMHNWTAGHFRATLQAYFLPVSTLGMIGYWYKGLWGPAVTHYFFISVPVMVPAVLLGRYFNHRIRDGAFLNYVYIGLICIGKLLLGQSLI